MSKEIKPQNPAETKTDNATDDKTADRKTAGYRHKFRKAASIKVHPRKSAAIKGH